ncbi:MAG TPA: hypothetical protein VED01_03850 [Burkholderiales bacterium]|nr:hypothetical protein [Burkholderiales bacterium]
MTKDEKYFVVSLHASAKLMSNDKDTLRDEYPEELIRSGVRGKYAKAYREGTNVVLIEPDLHKLFPDSEAVNGALREYVATKRAAT